MLRLQERGEEGDEKGLRGIAVSQQLVDPGADLVFRGGVNRQPGPQGRQVPLDQVVALLCLMRYT